MRQHPTTLTLKGAISMCIYCGTTKYRKIYEQHNGPIPKEENGRAYEIHHIDGNHSNNDPVNLKCVTIQEHYDIHYSQGDYGACLLMGNRMKLLPKQISDISKLCQQKRVVDGTHNLLGNKNPVHQLVENGTHHWQGDGDHQRKLNKKRMDEGTHNWLDIEHRKAVQRKLVEDGTHPLLSGDIQRLSNKKRVEDGTHHWLDGEINRRTANNRVKNGTHTFLGHDSPSQLKWKCIHCNKEGKGKGNFSRSHGDKCKFNSV